MEWYEMLGIVLIPLICLFTGYFIGKRESKKDDGIVMLDDERCEVIFRDSYPKLIKKQYVKLKIQS